SAMQTAEKAMKMYFVRPMSWNPALWKTCSIDSSDAQLRHARLEREQGVEHRPGHEERRPQIGDDADGEGDREPLHRTRAEAEKREGGDERGDVAVDDGRERLL